MSSLKWKNVYLFSLTGNAINNYPLKLKESPVILKLKPSLNIAKEFMSLYLFEKDGKTICT